MIGGHLASKGGDSNVQDIGPKSVACEVRRGRNSLVYISHITLDHWRSFVDCILTKKIIGGHIMFCKFEYKYHRFSFTIVEIQIYYVC